MAITFAKAKNEVRFAEQSAKRKYQLAETTDDPRLLKMYFATDLSHYETFKNPKKYFRNEKLAKDKRSFIDDEGHWHIKPLAMFPGSVLIVCPYCGYVHRHGRDKVGKEVGWRGVHCDSVTTQKDYYITDPTIREWVEFYNRIGCIEGEVADAIC